MPPTWCFFNGASSRSNLSTTGIRYAKVFPLPVTASTTTSRFRINSGMVEACTGVIRVYPMSATAPRIHSANEGVNASQARDAFVNGAIVGSIAKWRVGDSGSNFPNRRTTTGNTSTGRQSILSFDHSFTFATKPLIDKNFYNPNPIRTSRFCPQTRLGLTACIIR